MKIWKGSHFQKNYDDFMIFSYDKIYDHKCHDHKCPVTKCTISGDRKTIKITA